MSITPAHDVVSTSPTNVFATLNPLAPDTGDDFSMSEGNLRLYTVSSFASDGRNISTIPFLPAMGKIYIEVAKTTNAFAFGFSQGNNAFGIYGNTGGDFEVFAGTNANGQLTWQYRSNSGHFPALNTSATEVIGVLIDFTNSQFKIKLASTDYTYSFSHSGYINFSNADNILLVCNNGGNADTVILIFGVDPTFAGYITLSGSYGTYSDANGIGSFYYQPPTGALALCTANIQSNLAIDPAEDDVPEDYFRCINYVGNVSSRDILGTETGGSALTFSPDLVWIKNRGSSSSHALADSVRGDSNILYSNETYGSASDNWITGMTNNLNKFTVSSHAAVNQQAKNIIAWCWKSGGAPTATDDGTGVSGSAKLVNASGTGSTTTCKSFKDAAVTAGASNVICPSKMSINQKSGFSIATYSISSTTSDNDFTIPHGLNKAPEFIIVKKHSPTWTYWITNVVCFS